MPNSRTGDDQKRSGPQALQLALWTVRRILIPLCLLPTLACAPQHGRVAGPSTAVVVPTSVASTAEPDTAVLAPALAAAFPRVSSPMPALLREAPRVTVPDASATAPPTVTPPVPTPTASPEPTPTEDLTALQAARPNELGQVMVLAYHLIEEPEDRWSRTPANFRADIERLIAEGYYPVNLIDLALGQIDVPAGKSPIVLTFDDSSSGQFRYLADGTTDPNSAVGILQEAARLHPSDWRLRATFYVLLDVDVPDRVLFGQPEWAEQKLRDLVGWGMEVGSHTISHWRLPEGTADKARWQLAVSENTIEDIVPGYEMRSLSPPLGLYPPDLGLIRSGEWEGQTYDFQAVVEVGASPSASPFSTAFDPYHIARVQAMSDELDKWLGHYQTHPELRYVSDGDPDVVTVPDPLPPELEGTLRSGLPVRWVPAAP